MTDKQDLPPLPTLPFAVFDEFGASCEDRVRDHFHAAIRSHEAERGAQLAEMEARKDAAYLERNQVVAALASAYPSGIARTAIEGWSEDWHGCVYIDLPTGQASWHYHDSQAHLFAHLPPYSEAWDGHTTEEKYQRLSALAAEASKPVQAEAPRCSYPQCTGEQPADGSCCKQPFTSAMADAAERYWRAVGPNAHPLPAQFRWVDCFRAMEAAAPSPKASNPVQVAQDGDLLALLEEVSRHYTREDDLPDNLLPRIDAAIDAARTRGEGA